VLFQIKFVYFEGAVFFILRDPGTRFSTSGFFIKNNSPWATDTWVKAFTNMTQNLRKFSTQIVLVTGVNIDIVSAEKMLHLSTEKYFIFENSRRENQLDK
jgi:hypothetical protein